MSQFQYGDDRIEKMQQGYRTAFINASENSSVAYKPEFVSNNPGEGQKVLSSVEKALQNCEEFIISVAFITRGGITPLLQTLDELEKRGIPGRILTTDYLNFSEPDALRQLNNLTNIELRMFVTDQDDGFHTKGYIFRRDDMYQIIVGSSNLTMTALTRNKEWNTRVISMKDGEYARDILEEFDAYWNAEQTLPYDEFIEGYSKGYEIARQQRKAARQSERLIDLAAYRLRPNTMQRAFIDRMRELQDDGASRALLISATGTGKTYASAFALRELASERVLFLVHREQIARQALESYRRVFGTGRTYGLLSGNSHDHDADILFATMQTMSKDDVMASFDRDAFTTIVVDEVHKAGAASYQKIMQYFEPQMWLGMTATPERTDGYDIYNLFDHNIAYEIRLQQALEEDLLCPFHYFGITDITIDGEVAGDTGRDLELKDFNYLTSDARVQYIMDRAAYYGHSGNRVKGLIFVSRKDVGQELSRRFNERGWRTVFMSGDTRQDDREHYVEMLETDDLSQDYLDYILTVDIFNEGVDIPQVNQVLMLRPTQSPIIFVQQLGRGLRKAEDKEFVVVIDFIGNYTNNYMIPIALSGDRSYNKDNMRRYVSDGCRIIPGSSTIHFDEISRRRIYSAIDSARTNAAAFLRESYTALKFRLGRIPNIADFEEYGSVDIQKYIRQFGSYYEFLVKYEKDYTVRLTASELEIIQFLSQKLSKGMRKEDLALLKDLIYSDEEPDTDTVDLPPMTPRHLRESVENTLMNRFPKKEYASKHASCVLIQQMGVGYELTRPFYEMLISHADFKAMVEEIIEYGLHQYETTYAKGYRGTNLVLNQKYTYEDVLRLLNWERDENALNIGGYKYDERTHTLPVFINYDKADDAIPYQDRFLDSGNLIALSKHPRRCDSSDADHFYKRTERDRENRIFLFVRKNKDDQEAKEFYFLGEIEAVGEPEGIRMDVADKDGNIKTDDAFEIHYVLKDPVREDIMEYIESSITA